MRKILLLASTFLFVTACASTPKPATASNKRPKIDRPAAASAPLATKRGLESVMGRDAAALKRMFGEPRLDVIEVDGRKLQFAGTPCVLDLYLYANVKGGAEVVTYVDARRSDGAEVDRASCVNALQRR